jgi:chemotaxis protein histidine kinase CheA
MDYFARVSYVGDGVTNTFSIPFDYLDQSHVKAFIDGVEEVNKSFPSAGQIQLSSTPPQDSVVLIRRETPKERLVDFQNASMLDEEVLDLDSNQMLYITQEASDEMLSAMMETEAGTWDAKDQVIKNVGDPVDPNDAVNKTFADAQVAQAQSEANRAEAEADAAANSASSAATSETNAASSESNAAASEAQAIESEQNAAQSASSAANSAANAASSENNAASHEDNAKSAMNTATSAADQASASEAQAAQSAQAATQVVSDNHITLGGRYRISYNPDNDTLEVEVI